MCDFIIENNDARYTKNIINFIHEENVYENLDYEIYKLSQIFKLSEESIELLNYLKSKNIEIPDF